MEVKVNVCAATAEYDGKKLKIGPSIAKAEVGKVITNKEITKKEPIIGSSKVR